MKGLLISNIFVWDKIVCVKVSCLCFFLESVLFVLLIYIDNGNSVFSFNWVNRLVMLLRGIFILVGFKFEEILLESIIGFCFI